VGTAHVVTATYAAATQNNRRKFVTETPMAM
jgi:hypothetical protein